MNDTIKEYLSFSMQIQQENKELKAENERLKSFIAQARLESELIYIKGKNKIAVPYWFMKDKTE